MQKALSFLKPYSLLAGIALILMLTELAVELMQPLLIAKIIDDGILKQDLRHVWIWGTVMIDRHVLGTASRRIFAKRQTAEGALSARRIRASRQLENLRYSGYRPGFLCDSQKGKEKTRRRAADSCHTDSDCRRYYRAD